MRKLGIFWHLFLVLPSNEFTIQDCWDMAGEYMHIKEYEYHSPYLLVSHLIQTGAIK